MSEYVGKHREPVSPEIENLRRAINEASPKLDRGYIEFEESAVRDYLEDAIKSWRDTRDRAENDSRRQMRAMHYIDAFQSVYTTLFGDTYRGDVFSAEKERR